MSKKHCFSKKKTFFSPKTHCFPTCAPFYPIVLKRKNITGSMFKFINAEMAKKRERSERANFLELFDLVCLVWCVSWWKLDLFKVKIDVCVRYKRISAYCVPTLCVLRTVKKNLNTAYQKGGCHPHWMIKHCFHIVHMDTRLNKSRFYKTDNTNQYSHDNSSSRFAWAQLDSVCYFLKNMSCF